MKKAKNEALIWLILTVFAAISGLPMALVAVLSALKLEYFLMSLCVLLSLHGIWGAGFYCIAYKRAKLMLLILDGISKGKTTVSELSEYTSIKAQAVEELLLRAQKRGYIEDFAL